MSTEIPTISPSKAIEVSSTNPSTLLLDVRTPSEFSARRARGTRNIPLDSLQEALTSGEIAGGKTICVLCEKGGRARIAAEHLLKAGLSDVHVVEGGTEAWASGGFPIEGSGRRTISIERQVRIGAGSLVLIGIVLGILVHPGFLALSAFIGAGLVFAGITDWCGMGLLLARAPWNR